MTNDAKTAGKNPTGDKTMTTKDSLSITDNRTGAKYDIPVLYGTYPKYGAAIRTADLRKIKVADDDFGIMGYDPAFTNTASCKSAITFIDGDRGILRYRGYPIEELAAKCTYLEVAYLILHGELPNPAQLKEWTHQITHHTLLHENTKKFMDGFHHDSCICASSRCGCFRHRES